MPSILRRKPLLLSQSHESLRSYLERNIYLNSQHPSAQIFRKLPRSYLRVSAVLKIAEALGRDDTYGFSQLLHDHTSYPQLAIFNDAALIGCSPSDYAGSASIIETKWLRPRFCVKCAREDIEAIGFSYWRRDHSHVDVCWRLCRTDPVVEIILPQSDSS